jgi:hypothetical protein
MYHTQHYGNACSYTHIGDTDTVLVLSPRYLGDKGAEVFLPPPLNHLVNSRNRYS